MPACVLIQRETAQFPPPQTSDPSSPRWPSNFEIFSRFSKYEYHDAVRIARGRGSALDCRVVVVGVGTFERISVRAVEGRGRRERGRGSMLCYQAIKYLPLHRTPPYFNRPHGTSSAALPIFFFSIIFTLCTIKRNMDSNDLNTRGEKERGRVPTVFLTHLTNSF